MSIFSKLGRRAEELKQHVTPDPTHACRSCEKRFREEVLACPHCGSDDIVELS